MNHAANQEQEPVIRVQMLGGFSIRRGDREIVWETDRNRQLRVLLEYLIANRQTAVSLDKLYDALWEDGESDNPANALKNLVYRMRRLLKSLCPEKPCEFVLFSHGRYLWNNALPCTVDTEEFEKAFYMARRADLPQKDRIEFYRRAVALYRGEFLPGSESADWVVRLSARFQSLYAACVTELSGILLTRNEYQEAILLCEKAIELDPFQESVHEMLIRAYLQAGERARALDHYRYVASATMQKLGVTLSEGFRQRVDSLLHQAAPAEESMEDFVKEMEEEQTGSAYDCEYRAFREICRLETRLAERNGRAVFLSLFTIRLSAGAQDGERLCTAAMTELRNILLQSLRKGDMVTQANASQFLVMLVAPGMAQARTAVGRIIDRFGRRRDCRHMRLITRVRQLVSAADKRRNG